MFCDLLGAAALRHERDPGEVRECLGVLRRMCAEVIHRYEGHVALDTSESLVVHFGHPLAHEDDARRAVLAGLNILGGVAAANQSSALGGTDPPLDVRIGLHSGLVVVGTMGGEEEPTVMSVGETPNLAARVRDHAGPHELVISAATHRLVQGFFATEPLGPQRLKGISRPVELHRVLGATGARSRLDVVSTAGLSSHFGRERETAALAGAWRRASEQRTGTVVLVTGEAGIGKSRLVRVLRDQMPDPDPATWLECRCSPYFRHSPFHPVSELLDHLLMSEGDDSPERRLERLAALLAPCGMPLSTAVPLVANLLSLPLSGEYRPSVLPPEQRRRQTMDVLIGLLAGMAHRRASVLVVEDLHWADASSLELLGVLVERPPEGLLAVFTFRPDFEPPWPPSSDRVEITLSRLDRGATEALAEQVAGGRRLPAEILSRVVARTDGVPLFVEELTRTVLESGLLEARPDGYALAGPVPALAIPDTLHDSLMARLDRLGTAKELAQLAATFGREFDYEILQGVAERDEPALRRDLDALTEAELLAGEGAPPRATYRFRHALIQEAAYESLLRRTRRRHHHRIARLLEERFPLTVESRPELLAHHYTGAGLAEPAVGWWLRAGQRAIGLSANVEAVAHLTTGLELLRGLPESRERTERELSLLVTLATPLMATKGYVDPEVDRVLTRARDLCRDVDETPLAPVLMGLLSFSLVRAELRAAGELGRQLLRLGSERADEHWTAYAQMSLGFVSFYLGHQPAARERFEAALRDLPPERPGADAIFLGVYDARVGILRGSALVLWLLGHPGRALERAEQAIAEGERLPTSWALATALAFAAVLHHWRGEPVRVRRRAERALALSTEQGFAFWVTWAEILLGWAQAVEARRSGDGTKREEAIARIRRSLVGLEETGSFLWRPYWLSLLAEAHGVEEPQEALAALREALEVARRTGERWWHAELHRLEAELHIARSPDNQARPAACLRRAVDVARRQGARGLERRASAQLERLVGAGV